MDQFFQFDWSFIDRVGDNPFQAMLFFFLSGGWIVILVLLLWGSVMLRKEYKQTKFSMAKTWILLAIDIPRMHEQGPRAVENAFAYMAGLHSKNTWTEEWIDGRTQDTIACEIVSIEGRVQFLIRTVRKQRDLVEASIFSQYPDAEITEVEDYTLKVPGKFPDEEWDLWGTEFVPTTSDVYPLRTYPFFEDKVSGEFKDPLSAMLEGLSRLGPGEQAWYQIVLTPIGQVDFYKKADAVVKKMKGEEVKAKKNLLDKVTDLPIHAMGMLAEGLIGGSGEVKKPVKKEEPKNKVMGMTQGEKDVMAAIENKASKIVYGVKIRFLYVAKKEKLVKSHIVHPIIGSIKQFNTNNMMSLKPESKKVGVSSALWWFKDQRNNERKQRLMAAYRRRSNWSGMPNFHLCIEELASLWHFPHAVQVRSPQLSKTESKRSEPPANIPFG